jgi:elongation factor P--beta-lysine ligase
MEQTDVAEKRKKLKKNKKKKKKRDARRLPEQLFNVGASLVGEFVA